MQDGVFVRQLPADILKEINIVDTPGTNVVLERQQRLTEEYVPRADLVIFVMSADRPFAESEVNFLRYIRKWGKKIIFVVNKVGVHPVYVAPAVKLLLYSTVTIAWKIQLQPSTAKTAYSRQFMLAYTEIRDVQSSSWKNCKTQA